MSDGIAAPGAAREIRAGMTFRLAEGTAWYDCARAEWSDRLVFIWTSPQARNPTFALAPEHPVEIREVPDAASA